MLELRPNCECCDGDLPPESRDAMICTYECTFCSRCAGKVLKGVCPNCGGELVRRPVRPAEKLVKDPASTTRVVKPGGCGNAQPVARPTAKALGIGGIFFKSPDPAALRAWYARCLGIEVDEHGAMFAAAAMPPGAVTVWSPFAQTTNYFDPSRDAFMFNMIVDDLDAALAQVKAGGANLIGNVEEYDYGRFGWFVDPDGHKVELWEPPAS